MSAEIPTNTPKNKETLDDNARKFIVEAIDPDFISDNSALSYILIVDWIQTGADNEKKVVYKQFDNGNIQMLLVSKITTNGNRTSEKLKISEETYREFIATSALHLEKKRHELTYEQKDVPFNVTYDEFAGGTLNMLEVDAADEAARNLFDPDDFPATLIEVTGDMRYYGYRVAALP